MYVILTHKLGHFHTEPVQASDLKPVEAWDYLFYGKKKAQYVIAELDHEVKVKVVDENEHTTNYVPSKFLPRFSSLEEARRELKHLISFGKLKTELVKA
jgi:hypothetical protein